MAPPVRLLVGALLLGASSVAAAQNVAEVQVAPPSISIKVGDHYGLLATAYDRQGNVVPTARAVWSSNNPQVARVDNNGTVTGVAPGVALIEAKVRERRGQAAVQVMAGAPTQGAVAAGAGDPYAGQPPGTGAATALRIDPPSIYLLPSENTRIYPRALRDDGSPAAPVQVTWKSLREDIASVNGTGVVVALAPGQGTIQMTGPNGLTATAPVVVQQAAFAIQEGSALSLSPDEVDSLHVIVPTQENRLVNPQALTWSSSDQTVAQVSLTGVVKAVGSGKATLTVSGLLQQSSIEVLVHRAVQLIEVKPPTRVDLEVPLSANVHMSARALAADTTPVPEARLVWAVVDTAIATFDSATGMLTGRKTGRTQVTVTVPGPNPLTATWQVSVIAASLKLASTRLGLRRRSRAALTAGFIDDTGAALGPASGLTWSSDAPDIAAVDADGTVTGVGYGHAHVTATAPGGHTATADVFVESELMLASSRGGQLQLYWVERGNLGELRRASADTAEASDPAFSPDGSRIAFVSTRDGNPEIYLMDADGANVVRLTDDPHADARPAFTADGTGLVFESQRSGRSEVYSMALDGSNLQALTTDSTNMTPTVSPDGRIIAYASVRNKSYDIWLMSPDGSNQRAFTTTLNQNETEPHFLRDGSLAYLVERREDGRPVRQVVKADLATGTVTPLTGTDLAVADFAVSPAGDLIALVAPADPNERRHPVYRIYFQPTGGTPTPIPAGPTEQMVAPAFLP
jgi:Tol biopolymer transport system component